MTRFAATAARGALHTGVWQVVRIGLNFVSVILLARLLGPEQIGLVSMVLAVIGIGTILKDFGLSLGAVRAKTLSHEEKSNLFWVNTALGVTISLLFFVLAEPIAAFYGEPALVWITRASSLTFAFHGFATQFQAELHRRYRLGALGFVEAASQALGVATAILLALKTPTYHAIIAQQLVQAGSFAGLAVLLSRWWPGLPRRSASIRHIVRFGAGLSGTQVLSYVSKNIDTVLVGWWWGAGAAGVYSRAFQLVTLPLQQLLAPLSRVTLPLFARMRDDREALARNMLAVQTVVASAGCAFFGLLAAFAPLVVELLLGPAWMAAGPIITVLAFGAIFKLIAQVPYWIYVTHGATGRQFLLYLIGQPIIIAGIVAGLPFGSVGVAWGSSIGYAAFWALQLHFAGRLGLLDTRPLFWNSARAIACVGAPSFLIPVLLQSLALPRPAAVALSLLALAGYLLTLIWVDKSRRTAVTRLLKAIRKPARTQRDDDWSAADGTPAGRPDGSGE